VFTTAAGGPPDDVNLRNRVWYPAVEAAASAGSGPGRQRAGGPPGGFCRRGQGSWRSSLSPAIWTATLTGSGDEAEQADAAKIRPDNEDDDPTT